MKILYTLTIALLMTVNSHAATYLLLTQTNALAAGITNSARTYSQTNAAGWSVLNGTNVAANPVYAPSMGVGVSPATQTMDVESTTGATDAKFGSTLPIYLGENYPLVGFNAYYAGGFKFGKGSAGNYGGALQFNPANGSYDFFASSAGGNAGDAATMASKMNLSQAGDLTGLQSVVAAAYDSTAPTAVTETGGAYTIDFLAANRTINLTLTGACTFAYANLTGTAVRRVTVNIKNAQATNCALSFPTGTATNGIIGYNTAGKLATIFAEHNPGWSTNVSMVEAQ